MILLRWEEMMDIAPKLNRRTLLTATAGFAVAGLPIGRALSDDAVVHR